VNCLLVAWPLWLLGYPDQALERSREALTLAHEISHPYSLAYALQSAMRLHRFRREVQAAREQAEALVTLADQHGFARWRAGGMMMCGWALAVQGQEGEGMAQMHHGLTAWRAMGIEAGLPYWLAMLAEAYGSTGQVEAGRGVLAEALTLVGTTKDALAAMGMGQSEANQWIHVLLPALLAALRSLGDAPTRSPPRRPVWSHDGSDF
jgi:predicted ATPase